MSESKLVKFVKPKILMLDMPPECASVLTQSGYNVTVGSLGKPYRVTKATALKPICSAGFTIPNIYEQEIVFVNVNSFPPEVGVGISYLSFPIELSRWHLLRF